MRVLLYCEMLLTFDTRHFNEFHLHKIIITRNVLIAICIGGVPTRRLCLRTRRGYQTELEMESVSRAEGARAARSNATARLTKTKKSQKRRQRRRRRKHSVDSDIDAAARTTRHSKCHSAVPQQVALYGGRNRSHRFPQNLSCLCLCVWTSVKRVSRGHFCASRRLINE